MPGGIEAISCVTGEQGSINRWEVFAKLMGKYLKAVVGYLMDRTVPTVKYFEYHTCGDFLYCCGNWELCPEKGGVLDRGLLPYT